MEFNYSDEENQSKSFKAISTLVTNNEFKPNKTFLEVTGTYGKRGMLCMILYLLLSPLVFRYALYSASTQTKYDVDVYETGNATVTWDLDYDCEECQDFDGLGLRRVKLSVANVTNPDLKAGFPSIAIFASNDFKTWYNFFSTPVNSADAYLQNYNHTNFGFNQSSGNIACLGNVYLTYMVACVNVRNIALQVKKGEIVPGPPFNDR